MVWLAFAFATLFVGVVAVILAAKFLQKGSKKQNMIISGFVAGVSCIVASILLFIPITVNRYKLDAKYGEYVELLQDISNRDQMSDIDQLQLDLDIQNYNMWYAFNEPYMNDPFSFKSAYTYNFDYIGVFGSPNNG